MVWSRGAEGRRGGPDPLSLSRYSTYSTLQFILLVILIASPELRGHYIRYIRGNDERRQFGPVTMGVWSSHAAFVRVTGVEYC